METSEPIAEIKDRLDTALKIRHINAAELSRRTGISTGSLSQYRTGKVKPKQDRIYLMAQALQVDEAWLMGYDTSMEKSPRSKVPIANHIAVVPIYSPISCTLDGWIKNQAEGSLTFPFGWLGVRNYFANFAEGNFMEPSIKEGEILIFEDTTRIKSDEVGAFYLNGGYYCRRYKILPDGSRWLFSNNPRYEPILIQESDKFRVLGVYVAKVSKEQ